MSIFRLCLLLLVSGLAAADERIMDYHSDVQIQIDGSLMVTETIKVRAEGKNIRRGIYRDFPTRYKDKLGNNYTAELSVLGVQRNGAAEAFHTEARSNGVRIYIGSASHLLDTGVHEYQLNFRTNRQLGFFEAFDELYWNATGSGWMFPIDHASARITLPEDVGADGLRVEFFTGAQGSSDKMAESRITNSRTIEFQTTRKLNPYEGLTVAVAWPKGIVKAPTSSERAGFFLKDNGAALVLLMGLLAPMGWFLWAWNRYGRDPKKGVIIPRFKPPTGLTPAGCNYISKMSFNKEAFSAAIISLGVKGYLEIIEDDDEFTLRTTSSSGSGTASKGEQAAFDKLFMEQSEVSLDNKNHRIFALAQSALKKALKGEHFGRMFNINGLYAIPAAVMTIIAVVVAVNLQGGPVLWFLYAILSIVIHIVFMFLMRAPTPAGRQIMDEIEGFKMYLNTAEQDRLDRMKSPALTPEVFESFLPYAYALGVENSWCDQFTREFPQDPGSNNNTAYNPAWYLGSHTGMSALNHLGADFGGSFSTAISSASTPPGSSSGSGGGGFSGGGGGGGGGGGW